MLVVVLVGGTITTLIRKSFQEVKSSWRRPSGIHIDIGEFNFDIESKHLFQAKTLILKVCSLFQNWTFLDSLPCFWLLKMKITWSVGCVRFGLVYGWPICCHQIGKIYVQSWEAWWFLMHAKRMKLVADSALFVDRNWFISWTSSSAGPGRISGSLVAWPGQHESALCPL